MIKFYFKSFLFFILASFLFAQEDSFTINFKNVPIIEYINFVSKNCNVNFVYEDANLNFSVTIVSDEQVPKENIMATLIHLLRIHGLTLLEEDGNLVIHTNPNVKQIAKIITDNSSLEGAPPIVTRVFRIRNAKLDSLAAILRPMISTEALMELSADTRQLIITDLTTNVKKISDLIEIIDSPQNPLEIETYKAKENAPEYLIQLANQIMNPITEGSPFILVPQSSNGTIFIVSTPKLIEKAISVLINLDTTPKAEVKKILKPSEIFVYKPLYLSRDDLIDDLMQMGDELEKSGFTESGLLEMIRNVKMIKDTESLLFTGSPEDIAKLTEILTKFDLPSPESAEASKKSFFTYKPVNRKTEDMQEALKELTKNLAEAKIADSKLLNTLKSIKIIESTQSLLFTGNPSTFPAVNDLVVSTDLPSPKPLSTMGKITFLIYKIQKAPVDQLLLSLKNTAQDLKKSKIDEMGLIDALNSVKYIPETQSLFFIGDPTSLKQIQDLLPNFDIEVIPQNTKFLVYKPQNKALEDLASSLLEIASNLEAANLVNPAFKKAIDSLKINTATSSLLFTGDETTLKRIEDLLKTIDIPYETTSSQKKNLFMYQPQHATKDQIATYLSDIAKHIDAKDLYNQELKKTLENIKWIDESHSFLFLANEPILNKIRELLDQFDTKEEISKISTYFLYKLKNTSGDVIEEDLDNFVENLKNQKVKNPALIHVLENAKWVKETNSILLTGDPAAIEEAKAVVDKYDISRASTEAPAHESFFIYKPKYASVAYLLKSVKDIASNLKQAKLADVTLLNAIDSMRTVESTNSLAFTGTPGAIEKIKSILQDVDIPSAAEKKIQVVGKTTYLVYEVKNADPPKLISAIQSFTDDLKKSPGADKDFISALETIKFKSEINALLFTGTSEALDKVQSLLLKFDTTALAIPEAGPSSYFVYKPKNLTGPELQTTLSNFADNLKMTGFDDRALFNSIKNMKWEPETQSLLVSGEQRAIAEVKNLLETYDISKGLTGAEKEVIQPIEETSFLVYKLQYHKGDEIQVALKQIAKELEASKANVKKNLLNAINSIQWIQITNSLLCSGDKETVVKLKDLINSLDVPLKQVFIEMLVIETSFTNLLNFGLDWGTKFKQKNKFVVGASNNPVQPNNTPSTFMQNFSNLNEGTTPQGTNLPVTSGFDLGILGDVILHKGKSFLSLGSFLQAVQQDNESSVIMTPKLLTQDNKTSSIFIGQNIPYVGSATDITGAAGSTTTNLEYRDVGMNLTLTPVLGNTDTVTLSIDLSRTLDEPNAITNVNVNGVQGITTSKTTMNTTVHIPNKSFLVLSGMITDTKQKAKTGIPCLGGLPLIGAAFSESDKTDDKKNIVIFIRPHIINSYEDMQNITESQEEYFRDETGSPTLEHDFDEAIDTLKSYDEE